MAEPITPLKTAGSLSRGSFQVEMDHTACSTFCSRTARCIYSNRFALDSQVFILHSSTSTPLRTAQSFITPLHTSSISYSSVPVILVPLPSIIIFSLFALTSLDYSPALMSSIRLRIAELVQHRDRRASDIRRIYGSIKAAKGSKRYQQFIDIQAEIRCLKRVVKLVQHRANYIHKLLGRYHLVQKAKESKSYMQYKKIQVEIRYLKYRAQSFPKSTATVIDDIPLVSFSRLCRPFVLHSRSHVSSHNG